MPGTKRSLTRDATEPVPAKSQRTDEELSPSLKPDSKSENWFLLSLPANVRSRILQLLDKDTRKVLLGMKGLRKLVLAEPALWKVKLAFEKIKQNELEMEALGRIAGFAQKVILWLDEFDDIDWIESSVIPHLPQFPNVTEVEYGYLFGREAEPLESWAPAVLSLADHFERVTRLNVPAVFMRQTKSLFESLAHKWGNLRQVEINVRTFGTFPYGTVTGSFGFAEAVAEAGKLTLLNCLPDGSYNAHNAVRRALLALVSRGHKCLKSLTFTAKKAEDWGDFFPFFSLNSLTTLRIGAWDESAGGDAFSKKFLQALENMTNLKELHIHYEIRISESDMVKCLRRAQFSLQSLSLNARSVQPQLTDALLTTIAETQKGLEELAIDYRRRRQCDQPTSAGVTAVEQLPKMRKCTIRG